MKDRMHLNIASVVEDSTVDGPGLRTVVFVQGCDHHCPGCHNPELQGLGGYLMTAEDLGVKLANQNNNVTLSGGEPFLQPILLAKAIKRMQRLLASDYESLSNVWCYTGFTWEQLIKDKNKMKLVRQCDIIVDGRFVEELRDPSLKWRGSSNQRIIDVRKTLKSGEVVLRDS